MDSLRQFSLRGRLVGAAISGLLLATAFPKIGIAGAAWIAPALLLACAHGRSDRDAFRIGYVAGLATWLAQLYWLLLIPYRWHGIPLGPALGWLALSAFLALYQGVWLWLCFASRANAEKHGWFGRAGWAVFGAAAWVGLEMIRARLFGGFPWNPLGASQYRLLPLIQIAAFTGVYGVSFLVVWTSLTLYSAGRALLSNPSSRYIWLGEIILPLIAIIGICKFGMDRLRDVPEPKWTIRVAMIQPSIPQTVIWNPDDSDRRFAELIKLTNEALSNQHPGVSNPAASLATDALVSEHINLVLWPEAAVPKLIRYDEETFRAIAQLARSNRVWMIVGSDDAEPSRESGGGQLDYFNASFLISPDGEIVERYCKRNLVIFGEYLPLVRWLPFVRWFTPIEGGFTPGDRVVSFELEWQDEPPHTPQNEEPESSSAASPHRRIKTATLICFEDVFPQLVTGYVDSDTDFLINLTNNGWFGESAAQWQHATSAIFRAVENGVPLLRSCNNGLTCWIDARGRLRQVFRDTQGSEYGMGVMTADIPVLRNGEARAHTYYNRYGDWLGWGCVACFSLTTLMVFGFRS